MQRRPGCPFQRTRLRYDPTFNLEATYCYDHGIPYQEYLDRWSQVDRAVITAVALEKSARCSMCGSSQQEWDDDPYAYEAVRVTCPGCMRRETMNDDSTENVAKGSSVRLLPKAAAERMRAETARKAAEGTLRPRRRRSSS